MGRGIFSGVIWGSVIAVVSLWLLSQLGGMVAVLSAPPQEVAAVAPDAGTTSPQVTADTASGAPNVQEDPDPAPTGQSAALQSANTDQAPVADRLPAQIPEASNITDIPAEPVAGTAPSIEPTAADVAKVAPLVTPPAQPSTDSLPELATIAPKPQPNVPTPQDSDPVTPVAPPQEVVIAQAAPVQEAAPTVGTEPVQPAAPVVDQTPTTDFSTPVVVETPEIVVEEPEPAPEPEPSPEPEPDAETPQDAPTNVDVEVAVDDGEGTGLLQPPGEIGGQVANVRTNQLPTIGGSESSADPEPDPEQAPDLQDEAPAITQFAQSFENPEARPLMAIILLVDSEGPDPSTPGEPLPFPVSYVIDASKPNAGEIMAAYRRAGHEVIALAPLPEGATPKDVEVAFQTYLTAIPEAVVVMDIPSAVFQSGRIVATQVAEALAASGHGMITYSRGLNSATQVAEREGVPVALVFRDFDSDGQDGAAIKRFLDQAAFRAAQQSGVILVGRNRAETVKALLEWGLGNRASTVALAPVSAALLAQ